MTEQSLNDDSANKCLNPIFRKMAEATLAIALTERPEWASIKEKFAGAALVEIDSAVISYAMDGDKNYHGRAGIIIENPKAVLGMIVHGEINDSGEPQIKRLEIALDAETKAPVRQGLVPA